MRLFRALRRVVSGNMAGRKLKYPTPEAMQEAIDRYFADCEGQPLTDDNGKVLLNKYGEPVIIGARPLTVTGLALALGFTSRRALLDYQGRGKYKEVVEAAKLRIENYAEMRLYDKDGCNGARFNLQNNFRNWDADKAVQDDKKTPAINIICDIPRASTQADGEDAISIDPLAVSEAVKNLERRGGGGNG